MGGLVKGSANPNGNSQPSSSKSNPEASYRAGTTGLTKSELSHAPGWDADEYGKTNGVKEQSKVTQKGGKIKNSAFSRVKY